MFHASQGVSDYDFSHSACFIDVYYRIDSMFVEFIEEYSKIPLPPKPSSVTSPFEADLIVAGWSPGDEDLWTI